MDRRTILTMVALATLCIMVVSAQRIADRKNLSKKDRGGGSPIDRPTQPTTTSAKAEPVVAPSVKTSLNVAGRRKSGSLKATGRIQASIQSTGRQSKFLSARGSTATVPNLFKAEPITNQRLASSSFEQGGRAVQGSAIKSTGGLVQHSGSVITIYISPDFTFVILFGEYFPVVDGKIYIYGREYIVCQYTIALASSYICCNHNVHAAYDHDGTPASCCADSYYYPSKEMCCAPEIYDKYHADVGLEATCCGDIFYYPAVEICCSNYPYEASETGCCNGQAYDKSKYCCYGGYVYYNWVSYCGGCQNTQATVCCNGKQYDRIDGYECCDQSYINTYQQSCCNKQVINKATTGCCNLLPFNKANQKCCNEKDIKYLLESCSPYDPCSVAGTTCCNNEVINEQLYGCCGNIKYSKLTKQCCGNQIINPVTTGCCGGSQQYSKANQKCCNGNEVKYLYQSCDTYDPCSAPGATCCNNEVIDPHKTGCCGHIKYSKFNKQCCKGSIKPVYEPCHGSGCSGFGGDCCGNEIINPLTTGCCGGSQKYSKANEQCCNGVLKYKYQSCLSTDPCAQPGKICCAGVAHTISVYPQKICCGTSYVSSATYSCCSANAINKATTGCCGGQKFNKQVSQCCFNVIKSKYDNC